MILIPAGMSAAGALLTLLLPETSRRALERISDDSLIPTPKPATAEPPAQPIAR